jgi:hypothetical protein
VHRFGLIKESGIFRDSCVFGVDLGDWQLRGTTEIAVLWSIGQFVSAAGTYGRDHVVHADIGHAADVVALVWVAFNEETDHFGAEIGWSEPYTVALLIARERAYSLIGTGVWCGAIERRNITHSAPGAGISEVRRTIGI